MGVVTVDVKRYTCAYHEFFLFFYFFESSRPDGTFGNGEREQEQVGNATFQLVPGTIPGTKNGMPKAGW